MKIKLPATAHDDSETTTAKKIAANMLDASIDTDGFLDDDRFDNLTEAQRIEIVRHINKYTERLRKVLGTLEVD